MRQHVPELDRNLSNDEFLDLIVDCFHSVIFGTVDQNGDPHTNIIDIDFNEDGRLIFATTNQKSFYRHIKGHNKVSITALRGRETLTSIGFTLEGYVDEVSPQYSIIGSVYDLRFDHVFQKQFDFVNVPSKMQVEILE